MKRGALFAFAALIAMGFGAPAWAQDELTCEEARCQFQQQILDECQCTGAGNHGQFVSCASHLIKELEVPKTCHGKLQRCAARSVCGKQDRGFHTCTRMEFGVCLPGDTLTGPVCEHDGSTCATNTDCVVSSRCKITRHPETCEDTAGGEFLDLAPTCCSNCATE